MIACEREDEVLRAVAAVLRMLLPCSRMTSIGREVTCSQGHVLTRSRAQLACSRMTSIGRVAYQRWEVA